MSGIKLKNCIDGIAAEVYGLYLEFVGDGKVLDDFDRDRQAE